MTGAGKSRWIRMLVLLLGALALGGCAAWNPFAKPDLAQSVVVLDAAPGVAPPAGRGDVMTVLYSGDGGWADLDKQLGTVFAAQGVPVVGVNTFKYFWRSRNPDVAAQQLDALITEYLRKWHKQRVWLVGFSFGADVLPTLADRLSAANRARVAQMVLLSPSRDIAFEVELEGYMLKPSWYKTAIKELTDAFNKVPHYPAVPPIAALHDAFPVVCYYGEGEEHETACTERGLPGWVAVHAKPGGHHLEGSYQALAAEMLHALPSDAAPRANVADAAHSPDGHQPRTAHSR